jgi:predicted DNA-binding transcriptional regulator YafY
MESMPIPHRRADVSVLKSILKAIQYKKSVEIHYQSMSKQYPAPLWRWISPHALSNDGFRWHARSYCHEDNKFKDFLLSRILDLGKQGLGGASADEDRFWSEKFIVILAPNSELTQSQRDIIARDYEMKNGQLKLSVRKALLYYFKKRLRLDVSAAHDQPHDTPVVLVNGDEFETALGEASS